MEKQSDEEFIAYLAEVAELVLKSEQWHDDARQTLNGKADAVAAKGALLQVHYGIEEPLALWDLARHDPLLQDKFFNEPGLCAEAYLDACKRVRETGFLAKFLERCSSELLKGSNADFAGFACEIKKWARRNAPICLSLDESFRSPIEKVEVNLLFTDGLSEFNRLAGILNKRFPLIESHEDDGKYVLGTERSLEWESGPLRNFSSDGSYAYFLSDNDQRFDNDGRGTVVTLLRAGAPYAGWQHFRDYLVDVSDALSKIEPGAKVSVRLDISNRFARLPLDRIFDYFNDYPDAPPDLEVPSILRQSKVSYTMPKLLKSFFLRRSFRVKIPAYKNLCLITSFLRSQKLSCDTEESIMLYYWAEMPNVPLVKTAELVDHFKEVLNSLFSMTITEKTKSLLMDKNSAHN